MAKKDIINSTLSQYTAYDALQVFNDVANGNVYTIDLYKNSNETFPSMHDIYDNNLLHIAVLEENNIMVKCLLNKNVSTLHKNRFNKTPLDYALMTQNKEIIELLMEQKMSNLVVQENKTLKRKKNELETEVCSLKDSNKRLKTSVENMTQALRKK